jgi:hypothetical protein
MTCCGLACVFIGHSSGTMTKYFNMEIVGKSIGSGIRLNYSNKEAKLEFYFQIPTLEQLLELKITKFNKESTSCATQNIKGKKVTEETYKVFLKNILKQFSQSASYSIDFDTVPYEILDISPYLNDTDTFLEKYKNAREAFYNAYKKINPRDKISLENFNEDSLGDFVFECCPFYTILIANGWSTDLVEKNKNIFIRWTFSFDGLTNELVEDVLNTDIDNASIYDYIEPAMNYDENLIHLVFSPFDLDDYLLYYPYSLTTIFEHQLDLKKIVRTEPLEQIPDRYENI